LHPFWVFVRIISKKEREIFPFTVSGHGGVESAFDWA
jgi:hypothetical protein